jgi:gamma-glutamylcyclotransferase (GGCT)/AIG2-like uncharacterized protein YtfP
LLKKETLYTTNRVPYFAYGSNVDPDGMSNRAPNAVALGGATLPGYRLAFDAVATVVPSEDGRVFGALWSVSRDDLRRLDRYEGEGTTYDRRPLTVRFEGRDVEAFVYLLRNPAIARPPSGYYWAIERGFRAFCLPVEALQRATALAIDFEFERGRPV